MAVFVAQALEVPFPAPTTQATSSAALRAVHVHPDPVSGAVQLPPFHALQSVQRVSALRRHALLYDQSDVHRLHRLTWDPAAGKTRVQSRLRVVDKSVPDDPAVAAEVEVWVQKAFQAYRAQGADPSNPLVTPTVELDGREAIIRNGSTELTRILAQGIQDATGAEVTFYNSGTVRIDDKIPAGQAMTEYDVLRILPFGGYATSARIKGDLLQKILDQGIANRGSGGFLQSHPTSHDGTQWLIDGKPLDPAHTYSVAFNDFLLTGLERGLSYLKPPNPEIQLVREQGTSLRQVLAARLEKEFAKK